MPVALVQEADAASPSVTLGSATTAGNTVLVAVACLGSSPATGVTGVTLGGSPDNFALIAPGPSAQDTTSPNDYLNVSVWADPNCAGGSAAIAVSGTGVVATWAYEFSGVAGVADIARVFAVSTYQDSWLATTAQASLPAEAWVAVIGAANQTGTETINVTSGEGWATQTAYSGTTGSYDWGAISGYQTVNTVGTPSFNGNFSEPSFSATAIVTLGAGTPPVAAAAHAPLTGNVAVRGDLSAQGALNIGGLISQAGAPVGLTPTEPITGDYTAKPGDFVIVEAASNRAVTITFPGGAPDRSMIGVKLAESAAVAAVVQASGADVFDIEPPGTTQVVLNTTGQTFIAQYKAAAGTWYTQSMGQALPFPPVANTPLPADSGFVTWSYDPAYLSGTFGGVALPAGNVYVVKCPVRATTTCGAIDMWITSAGSSLTSGQNFAGVYSSAGSLLATTADLTSSWGSTGQVSVSFDPAVRVAISAPFVWAAFLANGTTPPSLAVTGNQTGGWAKGPGPVTAARYGVVAGPFTSLPPSFDPSSGALVAAAAEYWTALF